MSTKEWSHKYSNYKPIAPITCGYVMFVPTCSSWRTSDTITVMNSGLVEHSTLGYTILADLWFPVTDVLPPAVTLALSAFTRRCNELSEHEVTERAPLACVRIHVERAVRILKGSTILTNAIPDNPWWVKHVDDIFGICVGLQPQLLQRKTEKAEASEMVEKNIK